MHAVRPSDRRQAVPPGLTAGSGLKLGIVGVPVAASRSSRPHRRERIETGQPSIGRADDPVPPGLTAGSGLKPTSCRPIRASGRAVPPGLTAGSGLKLGEPARGRRGRQRSSRPHRRERIETRQAAEIRPASPVPPGLTAGSGLKHVRCVLTASGDSTFLPASPPGAD